MRSIQLLTASLQTPGMQVEVPFVYADMLRLVLYAPRAGIGMTTEEGLRATDISAVVRAAGDELLLEEADWQFLCSKLADFRWNVWGDAVADFVRAVQNAPSVLVKVDRAA